MNETHTVIAYLNAFSKKRLDDLAAMFADDIELIDWDNHVVGLDAVLEFNMQLFSSVKQIDVYIDQLGDGGNVVFAQIKVVVDGQALSVVDVITVENNKIKRIQAYKQ